MISSSERSTRSPGRRGHPRWPPTRGLAAVLIALGVVVATAVAVVLPRPAAKATWVAAPVTGGTQLPGATTADGRPTLDLPASAALPGTAPGLPWPSTGQATVTVDGVGSVGATPDQHPVPIASLAKVMTAYLVLRDHPMTTGDNGANLTVTDAEAAAYPSEVANNESLVKVSAGETLTERQALEALLLPSADNIARILARWDSGSIPAFVTKMNATATALHMTNTRYTDPSGYDPSTRSTADDQVLLGAHAMQLPAFAQIVALPAATIPVHGAVRNYNTLLGTDGVTGIKTGSTSSAGGCLLFAARRQVDGHTATILGAVLGQRGPTMHGLPQALSASAKLIEATGNALGMYTPIKAGQKVATIAGTQVVAATTITILGWPGLVYHLTLTTTATPSATPAAGALGRLELDTADEQETTTLVR